MLFFCLSGRCDPDDLKADQRPPLPPPRLQDPRPEEEDSVTDIEAELLWENQPPPSRGDVPDRQSYSDNGRGEHHNQEASSSRRLTGTKTWTKTGTETWSSSGGRRGGLEVCVMDSLMTDVAGSWMVDVS